ncbi:MAG: hypothetical protein JXJ20_15520 [Anaerolineae bacterium]|jgi:hypothetical protein|nr:hypothetical protein [Anaerolineae bacterium]
MSYTVEKIAGESVILVKLNADFDVKEAKEAFEASFKLLAEQTEPVYVIWDSSQSPDADLQAIMEGANVSRASRTGAPLPNELGSIVITNNPAVKMAMQGLNSEVYGHLVIPVFEEIDEALAYVHQQLGKT